MPACNADQDRREDAKKATESETIDLDIVWNEFILDRANKLQTSLDINQGKLVAGALFKRGGDNRDRLLLIIHHLVADGVSWKIWRSPINS